MIGLVFWFFIIIIFYAYAGYPLLVWFMAQFRPKTQYVTKQWPTVSLLIAAYNEEAVIQEKLQNSLDLDYPADRRQIFVAADGSDDRTPEIVDKFADCGVVLSYSPQRQGKMAAINRAMALTSGEIIVFSDANNLYAPDVLAALVAPFVDDSVGMVSGAKQILQGDGALGDSEGLYWKYESFIKQQETRLGNCTGVAGEILAIRRSLFQIPPNDIINDDFYMAVQIMQQGYRVVYTPNARSFERVSYSEQDEVVRRTRIVAGRYQALSKAKQLLPWRQSLVVWQLISHKFLRPLVPFAMLGALMSNVLALLWPAEQSAMALISLAWPFNWLMFGSQIIFYSAAAISGHTKQHSRISKVIYLARFLVNSNLAALIGLYRFATKQQTPLWQRVKRRDGRDDVHNASDFEQSRDTDFGVPLDGTVQPKDTVKHG